MKRKFRESAKALAIFASITAESLTDMTGTVPSCGRMEVVGVMKWSAALIMPTTKIRREISPVRFSC